MPLQATSGAASYDAFGGGVPVVPTYIEDVMSTYLYTGTGATQTITNGIDLSTKGGLVWVKQRDVANGHILVDTVRGGGNYLQTNTTGANEPNATVIPTFTTSGFNTGGAIDSPAKTFASWTFREQVKFFDVVTFTTGASGTYTFNHNLGSVPGCVMIKSTGNVSNWNVYHRSIGVNSRLFLEQTSAKNDYTGLWGTPTATTFTGDIGTTLEPNQTHVAYVFAHNAGGFGLTGADNVISCGSYTGSGAAGNPLNLGYEPQFLMVKNVTTGGAGYNWQMMDTMRGMSLTSMQNLAANLSDAETSPGAIAYPTATGFAFNYGSGGWNGSGQTYIYIAIRRGPMKVPTDATKVFAPVTVVGAGSVTTNFPVDATICSYRSQTSPKFVFDRLRGSSNTAGRTSAILQTEATDAETSQTGYGLGYDNNLGFSQNWFGTSGYDIFWNFQRAPSFFDEVCCNTASTLVNHNLGVAPEMVIYKARGLADNWYVCTANNGYGRLNGTVAWAGLANGSGLGVNLANVSSTQLSSGQPLEGPGYDMVAYLFATCAGVSKVGSYTGTGATQTIACGFVGGARFVLIKRTDSTGDWYVWDTARGIVSGNDPYLLLNTTAAEATSTDYIDPYSAGFELSSTAPAALNASGGSYIFLAIA
jgi:hypothetical protein